MRVGIDTNRLSDLFKGDAILAKGLGLCDVVMVPLFVLAELKGGFLAGSRQHHNELLLRGFLAKDTVEVLLPGRGTAEYYARIFAQLRRAGTPIPDNDLWIAALAIEHDLTLITRDRHFAKIPQLLSRADL